MQTPPVDGARNGRLAGPAGRVTGTGLYAAPAVDELLDNFRLTGRMVASLNNASVL